MNDFKTVDERAIAGSGSALVWIAGALVLLTSFPALFTRGLIGDDWTVDYIYWTEGLAGVTRTMLAVAHAGYSIPMDLFMILGQDTPNVVARIAGLGFHLLNGVLLYRILRQPAQTRPIAALATALFYLSPFYAIRLTQNALYDFFLFFYLLSYVLMVSPSRWLRWLAPVCLFFSLSLETLIALEPLRLLCIYGLSERWRPRIARSIPFGIAIVAIIVLRFTIMAKSGHYAGQYAPVHDIARIRFAFSRHLHALPDSIGYAYREGFKFLGGSASAIAVLITATLFALLGARTLRTPWLLRSSASKDNAGILAAVGAAIILLGALPYALVGIYAEPTRGETRLLFPSQFGALLLLAIGIQCFPAKRLRAAIAGGAIAVFALSTAHDAKWLLYDGLVTSDIQRQTRAALVAAPEPKVVELQISAQDPLFFRGRCLAANDMNAAQMLLRDDSKPRTFIYTSNCGDFTNPDIVPRGRCPVSYLDGYACPARRETWVYNPAPGIPPLNNIGMVELMSAVLSPPASTTGGRGQLMKLTNDALSPLPRADFKPPCGRPHLKAELWLLALPTDYCR
ncbi:MAG TPA: hypothetical protein VGM09_07610 [Bradyrhizobium sp.]